MQLTGKLVLSSEPKWKAQVVNKSGAFDEDISSRIGKVTHASCWQQYGHNIKKPPLLAGYESLLLLAILLSGAGDVAVLY